MSKLDFLKPLAVQAPKIARRVGKIIDEHGDGDGVIELSDLADAAHKIIETIFGL